MHVNFQDPAVKPILQVARRKATLSPPPIWMMRQAGRHLPEFQALKAQMNGFLDLCYTPDAATEATLQPIRRYGLDAAIIFSDILVVPHGLGQDVAFQPGPVLKPVAGAGDLKAFSIERMVDFLAPMYAAIRKTADDLAAHHPQTALYGFCGAPFTVASYMIEGHSSKDHHSVRRWAAADPEGFTALMDLLVEANARHLIAQIKAGADIVQIFDSWAGDLTPQEVTDWSLQPSVRIAEIVKAAHPETPVSLFPRGVGFEVTRYVDAGAFDVIGLSPEADLNARCAEQPKVAFQGNIDPQILVAGGAPLDAAIDGVLDSIGKGPLIFNLGHGVPPETPIAHVEQMINRVRS